MRDWPERRGARSAVVGAGLGRDDHLVTEYLLPALKCPCCGQVTTAAASAGAHPGTASYGPGVNTAAVLLAGYGNVPAERAAKPSVVSGPSSPSSTTSAARPAGLTDCFNHTVVQPKSLLLACADRTGTALRLVWQGWGQATNQVELVEIGW